MSTRIPAAPVIVAGMHRSGTTLLARLLSSAGVFMGRTLTANFESAFFQQINRDTLDSLGCSWACVEELPPASVLLGKFESLKKIIGDRLEDGLAAEYFGPADGGMPAAWGWKDPRNCLTLPFWRRFFPDARIAFIYRDPRDVAASLIARAEHTYQKGFRFDAAEARRRFGRYVDLWDAYNRRAVEGLSLFSLTAAVRYEDLVAEPRAQMAQLTDALQIQASEQLIQAIAQVRPERASAFVAAGDERLARLPVESDLFTSWYGDAAARPAPVATSGRPGDGQERS